MELTSIFLLALASALVSSTHAGLNKLSSDEVALLVKDTGALEELIAKLREEKDRLENDHDRLMRSLPALDPSSLDRHSAARTSIFSAHKTGTDCNLGVIGNWVETVDLGIGNVQNTATFNPASGIFTTGATTNHTGYYYFTACFLCDQTDYCEVTMQYNGANVATMANIDTYLNGNQRWAQMCQWKIHNMLAGSTFNLLERGNAGNSACKRSSNDFRYSKFNGFKIVNN